MKKRTIAFVLLAVLLCVSTAALAQQKSFSFYLTMGGGTQDSVLNPKNDSERASYVTTTSGSILYGDLMGCRIRDAYDTAVSPYNTVGKQHTRILNFYPNYKPNQDLTDLPLKMRVMVDSGSQRVAFTVEGYWFS